jgi:Tfp pilus assembly protein PilV
MCPPASPIRRPVLSGKGRQGFTIVEVMMASVILVVGFIGMISAITMGSEMLITARRQNLAAQIISHELDNLRLVGWSNTTTVGGITYTGGISSLAAGPTTITINSQFNSAIAACGLTTDTSNGANPYILLQRTVSDVVSGSMRQVTFTVTWQKSGTTTAANTPTGSWLQRLSLAGNAPIRRTYTRSGFGFYGKYGLNLNTQRS